MILTKSFLRILTQRTPKIALTHPLKFTLPTTHHSLSFPFSTTHPSTPTYFIFNHQKQPQLLKLELQYRSQQNISVFQPSIKASTGILDQMTIFKIFKVMEDSPYSHKAYQEFFEFVSTSVKRKSDNMLLLLATIKQRMAKFYKKENNVQQTLVTLQEALDLLEGSMVPPLLPYYSIYREFGLLHDELGNTQQARQILTQTVEILDDFVSHSDDNVSTDHYVKKQATAYNVLSRIDPVNSKKWIEKANSIWEKYTQNRFGEIQYAKTIANNIKKELKEDKEKGEAFYHFNLYKFQSKQMKDLLKKAKQEAINQAY